MVLKVLLHGFVSIETDNPRRTWPEAASGGNPLAQQARNYDKGERPRPERFSLHLFLSFRDCLLSRLPARRPVPATSTAMESCRRAALSSDSRSWCVGHLKSCPACPLSFSGCCRVLHCFITNENQPWHFLQAFSDESEEMPGAASLCFARRPSHPFS